ncbi:hypothetical protein FJY93_03590 [Candidatus Kaiserbacteria bacterium]|nr:hypothetical protein [Candidatus Kaiserbacteria bacterium]
MSKQTENTKTHAEPVYTHGFPTKNSRDSTRRKTSGPVYIPVLRGSNLSPAVVRQRQETIRKLKEVGALEDDECLAIIDENIKSDAERKRIKHNIQACWKACHRHHPLSDLTLEDCTEICLLEAAQNYMAQQKKTFRDFLALIQKSRHGKKTLLTRGEY